MCLEEMHEDIFNQNLKANEKVSPWFRSKKDKQRPVHVTKNGGKRNLAY